MTGDEYTRLSRWVTETSRYLDDVLPQLDMLEVKYFEVRAGNIFQLRFTLEGSKFIANVVAPTIGESLSRSSGRRGVFFVGADSCTFHWPVLLETTRSQIRRLFDLRQDSYYSHSSVSRYILPGYNVLYPLEMAKRFVQIDGKDVLI